MKTTQSVRLAKSKTGHGVTDDEGGNEEMGNFASTDIIPECRLSSGEKEGQNPPPKHI